MKQVNNLLSYADEALKNEIVHNNKIEEVFKGYVSSFGALVIQNGLPAALAINLKTDTSEGKQRKKVIDAIAAVLSKSGIYDSYTSERMLKESCNLSRDNNSRRLRILKQNILDASIALKLMMRTYEFIETKKTE
jgi:CRISPR-associated protein Cmr5